MKYYHILYGKSYAANLSVQVNTEGAEVDPKTTAKTRFNCTIINCTFID
jgi:hypothetical protein